jgi:hypothetical protein
VGKLVGAGTVGKLVGSVSSVGADDVGAKLGPSVGYSVGAITVGYIVGGSISVGLSVGVASVGY